jgi:hypothetical protein
MTWTQVAVPDRMPTGAQPGERILGQVSDEATGRAEAAAPRQPGRDHHRQRGGDLVPDPAPGAGH